MNLAHNLKLKRHSIEHFHAPYGTSDWSARRDSNPRPSESESAAISSFATGGYIIILIQIILIFNSKNFLCNSLLLKYAYIALFEKVCLTLFFICCNSENGPNNHLIIK